MASMMPLAILVWNQRRMPFQWRLTMCAVAIIGGRRLWVAHQNHFLRNASALLAGGAEGSWKARRMRYARPVLRFAAERLSSWARWRCDRLRGFLSQR